MPMKQLSRFSIGTGDRFGMEGLAQLDAFQKLKSYGIDADIVWNKSNREHSIIGSSPQDQAAAAANAVKEAGWTGGWFIDADHITIKTVDRFLPHCDFFTIDVAETIGKPASLDSKTEFIARALFLLKPGSAPVAVAEKDLHAVADYYLAAVQEAGKTYRHIAAHKPAGSFVVELSMDETEMPQTPAELAAILVAVGMEGIPVSTIAPRFPGKFLKGIDFIGDVTQFLETFEALTRVVQWAPGALGLPKGLKLSVHSGSDKFCIYRGIHEIVTRLGAGLHLKTAGTTWLEEIVGLAEAGGEGLVIAKEIYARAYERIDELLAPYTAVVEIDRARLPAPKDVSDWDSQHFVRALRHDPGSAFMQPDMRQLMHIAFRIAAEMGREFSDALISCRDAIARNVTHNLFERHFRPLLLD